MTPATPDLTTYRAVHVALRRGAHLLARGARTLDVASTSRRAAFARYWQGYAGEVLSHHGVEDDIFFPGLVATVPTAAAHLERAEQDHGELDRLMASVTEAVEHLRDEGTVGRLADLLDEMADHMDAHLDLEDADLLPLFERHMTAEEYSALDEAAVKTLKPGRQLVFTIAFVSRMLDPEDRAAVLAGAPFAFRLVERLSRRSHARLLDRAFGRAALAGAVA